MMEGFNFLDGISPWLWVAFGIVLGALEMATMSFFLIWPALGALVMALLLWLEPGLNTPLQLTLFAVVSVALTLVGRKLMMQYGDGGGEETLINNRAAQLVGRTGKVLEGGAAEGAVEVDGIRWRAQWDMAANLTKDAEVRVTGSQGMTLEVVPLT